MIQTGKQIFPIGKKQKLLLRKVVLTYYGLIFTKNLYIIKITMTNLTKLWKGYTLTSSFFHNTTVEHVVIIVSVYISLI